VADFTFDLAQIAEEALVLSRIIIISVVILYGLRGAVLNDSLDLFQVLLRFVEVLLH
jgi:hypothetical protein